MSIDFAAAMRRATRSTLAGNLGEATRQIREALGGRTDGQHHRPDGPAPSGAAGSPGLLDLTATAVDRRSTTGAEADQSAGSREAPVPMRPGRPLAENIRNLVAGRRSFGEAPRIGSRPGVAPSVAPGARYLLREFETPAGRLAYRIYVPAHVADAAEGVVLMLHGCKQDPDDFAVGTRFNEKAEAGRMIVVYPAQSTAANPAGCWNWFDPANQRRGAGEPAVLAALARAIAAEFKVPPGRTFVAGLSAGGAMAAILAETYPDVFAAAAIHSGLPTGSATDVASAFAAMKGARRQDSARPRSPGDGGPRMIVFHGTADRVVHPSNGEAIATARRRGGADHVRTEDGTAAGRRYSRIVHRDADGVAAVEHWVIEGHGHAWSGGNPAGSYTDRQGPDASAEMMRFFREAGGPG